MAWLDASEVELAPYFLLLNTRSMGEKAWKHCMEFWGAFLAHCLGNFGTLSHGEHTWRSKEWNGI